MSTMMEMGKMPIAECNVPVKSAASFFKSVCAPDGLARYYNPFGESHFMVVSGTYFCLSRVLKCQHFVFACEFHC